MPIEYRKDNGQLVWVRNPFTGAVTYFTHIHKKRSGFTRSAQETLLRGAPTDRAKYAEELRQDLEAAKQACPFCPGNESYAPSELLRISRREVFPESDQDGWLIRAVQNIIPRIPECCTGGRNESYVVVEDPRHFADGALGHEDLLYTGLLPSAQMHALLAADIEVARQVYANPAVCQVLIRKNQGRESGASQPHVHNQVIGSDIPLPTVAREREITAQQPHLWQEMIEFARQHGFLVAECDGCCAYFCAYGTFPRSYEIVCTDMWGRSIDMPRERWHTFGSLLYDVLQILGPIPLDYEIHDGPGVPVHAHINARHYPYSNMGGTLNLPSTIVGMTHTLR